MVKKKKRVVKRMKKRVMGKRGSLNVKKQKNPTTTDATPVPTQHIYKGTKKPLVIGIIVLVLLAGLAVLMLFSDTFVGQAYQVGVEGSAGIEPLAVSPVAENTPFQLRVKANIGAEETVAIGFVLNLPLGVTCADIVSISHLMMILTKVI